MLSVSPPAAHGTTSFMGRSGYSANAVPKAPSAATSTTSRRFISLLLWRYGRVYSAVPLAANCTASCGRMVHPMRIGILGGGVIARLVLEHARAGALSDAAVVGILGRSDASRGKLLARDFEVPFVTRIDSLLALQPNAVIEAASHEAVRQHAAPLLEAGVS